MKSMLLSLCLLLGGCTAANENGPAPGGPPATSATVADAAPAPAQAVPPSARTEDGVDYACAVAADCAIKDVGNCCGYYPACVNKDSPTFPEQVKADCKQGGMAGVCGFPSIERCDCVESRCTGVTGGAADVKLSRE